SRPQQSQSQSSAPPPAPPPAPPQPPARQTNSGAVGSPTPGGSHPSQGGPVGEGPGQRSRRRRRRRGRRGGGSAATLTGAPGTPTAQAPESSGEGSAPMPADDSESFDDGGDEAGGDDQVVEAMPALATHHDAPPETVQPAGPQH